MSNQDEEKLISTEEFVVDKFHSEENQKRKSTCRITRDCCAFITVFILVSWLGGISTVLYVKLDWNDFGTVLYANASISLKLTKLQKQLTSQQLLLLKSRKSLIELQKTTNNLQAITSKETKMISKMKKDIAELNRDYYEIRRKSSELSQKFEAFKNGANKIGTLNVGLFIILTVLYYCMYC